MTRVQTGTRLHFGLIAPAPDAPGRRFGGCGLMVERPAVAVAVEPAADWSAAGPHADRALTAARGFVASLSPGAVPPHHITVEACPPDHVGLGVGTQLALGVARAVADSAGLNLPTPELARRVGRGARSAIGVFGFDRGGFLVDGGKRSPDDLAPLVAHLPFPADWRVVLVTPAGGPRWHGAAEEAALAAATGADDALCRLVLLGLLPALAEGDLPAFGAALSEFNARAGAAFRTAQGGTYASPATAAVVAWLRAHGARGAGQSSWGPTAFGVVGDENEAAALAAAAGRAWGGAVTAVVTAGRNAGAGP
jgi:beta-RFAP synthase